MFSDDHTTSLNLSQLDYPSFLLNYESPAIEAIHKLVYN